MSFELTPSEIKRLELVPNKEFADLAADLSLIPDADIDRKRLIEALIPGLLRLGHHEGLPFSKYDAEDLDNLPTRHREALASAMGWSSSTRAMLKAGGRVYKTYSKERMTSQVPIMLPLLLPILARHADEVGRPGAAR
jgi:hypothetical protein